MLNNNDDNRHKLLFFMIISSTGFNKAYAKFNRLRLNSYFKARLAGIIIVKHTYKRVKKNIKKGP